MRMSRGWRRPSTGPTGRPTPSPGATAILSSPPGALRLAPHPGKGRARGFADQILLEALAVLASWMRTGGRHPPVRKKDKHVRSQQMTEETPPAMGKPLQRGQAGR